MWSKTGGASPTLFISVWIWSASGVTFYDCLPEQLRGRCLSQKKCFLKIGLMWLSWSLNPTGIKLFWNSFFFNLCLQSNRASVVQAVLWVAAAGLLLHSTQASKSNSGPAAGCRTQQGEKKGTLPLLTKFFFCISEYCYSDLWPLAKAKQRLATFRKAEVREKPRNSFVPCQLEEHFFWWG